MQKLYLSICFFLVQIIWAQTNPDQNIQISVLTVGTADASHSLYGHTAIRVKDNSKGTDLVYNYGMFDFSTPNFMLRFVKGDMQYFAAAYPYADFEYNYRFENRSIYEQVLSLSPAKKSALISALDASISGPDKFYTYKFINRNCTTKVAEILNDILQTKAIYKRNISELTYRDVLYPYAENHFFQKLGINLIFGTKVDEQATTIFLPFDLKDNLDHADYKYNPLVTQNKTLFEANRVPAKVWWDSIYTLIAVLTLIVVVNKKIVTHFYFIMLGLLGIFFCTVGFYSFHSEISLNYNALLINPAYLSVAYFSWKQKRNALLWSNFTVMASMIVYVLIVVDKIHLGIVWPILVANSLLVIRGFLTGVKIPSKV